MLKWNLCVCAFGGFESEAKLIFACVICDGTVEDDDGPKGPSGQSSTSRQFSRIVEQADETPQQSGSLLDSPFSVSFYIIPFYLKDLV